MQVVERDSVQILLRRQRWNAFLEKRIEHVQVDRLDQVMFEAGLVTLTNIVFHSETRKSDSEDRSLGTQLFHQIDSAAVGQAEIANKHIKFPLGA